MFIAVDIKRKNCSESADLHGRKLGRKPVGAEVGYIVSYHNGMNSVLKS